MTELPFNHRILGPTAIGTAERRTGAAGPPRQRGGEVLPPAEEQAAPHDQQDATLAAHHNDESGLPRFGGPILVPTIADIILREGTEGGAR